MRIGERIALLLQSNGKTIEELASHVGSDPETVRVWLFVSDDTIPAIAIPSICDFLHVSERKLLTGEDCPALRFDLTENEIRMLELFRAINSTEQLRIMAQMIK